MIFCALSSPEALTPAGRPCPIYDLAVSADGRRAVVCGLHQRTAAFDLALVAERDDESLWQRGICRVAQAADAEVVAAGYVDGTVVVTRAGEQEMVLSGSGGKPVISLCVSRDGRRVVAATYGGAICLWDARTGALEWRFVTPRDMADCLKFGPNDTHVACGMRTGAIHLRRAGDGSTAATCSGHVGAVTGIDFVAGTSQLASSGMDGTVRCWHAETGAPVACWQDDREPVLSVAVSPDGSRIATGDVRGRISVRQVSDGVKVLSTTGHRGAASCVAFLGTDGARLASAGFDGRLRLWNAAELREIACFELRLPEDALVADVVGGT